MQLSKRRIRDKLNKIITLCVRSTQRPLMQKDGCGYITIFHDYESDYALSGKKKSSYHGITSLLDIEKQHGITTTYNIVGKLFDDHPEIIRRIIEEGHDIASHSYDHKVMTQLSRKDIDKDIQQSKTAFQEYGLQLHGFRAPQSRWSFALMQSMLDSGLQWSAENDQADFPYIISKKGKNTIMRLPIKMDDWEYISKKISPEQMFEHLIKKVQEIESKQCYGAIGFHPWVQGENNNRLKIYDSFLSILKKSNINMFTFHNFHRKFVTNG